MKLKYMIPACLTWIAAIATAIPSPAHKANLMGYYSICSFAPASTLISAVIAVVILWIGKRREKP